MKLFALAFIATVLYAQPHVTVTAPATARPGETITAALGIDAVSGSDMVALEWTLPAGAVVVGTQPVVPDKSVACMLSACAIFGATPAPVGMIFQPGTAFNGFPLQFGPVQNFSFTIPATAAPGTRISLAPSGLFGVTSLGAPVVPIVVANDVVVRDVLDLNGDGLVDTADAQQAFNQWATTKTPGDFTTLVVICARLQQ